MLLGDAGLSVSTVIALIGAVATATGAITALIVKLYTAKPTAEKLVVEAQRERSDIVNEAAERAQQVYEAAIKAQQADLDRMRADNKDMREELTKAREEIARLQEQLKAIGEHRNAERDAMVKRIADLQAQVAYLETRVGGRRGTDPPMMEVDADETLPPHDEPD